MKTCPNCSELNGEKLSKCWKCNSSLGPVDTYKKICRKCNRIYSSKAVFCDDCGNPLSVYAEEVTYITQSYNTDTWKYIVSFLIPLVGFILGCIYISKDNEKLGKSLIITGVVSIIVIPAIIWSLALVILL